MKESTLPLPDRERISTPTPTRTEAQTGSQPDVQPVTHPDATPDSEYMRGYLRGLNEKVSAMLNLPAEGEEPYPEGQSGLPVNPDPFFIPDSYSVWD